MASIFSIFQGCHHTLRHATLGKQVSSTSYMEKNKLIQLQWGLIWWQHETRSKTEGKRGNKVPDIKYVASMLVVPNDHHDHMAELALTWKQFRRTEALTVCVPSTQSGRVGFNYDTSNCLNNTSNTPIWSYSEEQKVMRNEQRWQGVVQTFQQNSNQISTTHATQM